MQMLGARLSPKHVDGAIKYGFYMHTFGIPFKYWRASSFTEGVFNGKSLSWMPTTALERRILIRCLEAGVHNALIEQVVGGLSKIGSIVWNAPNKLAGSLRQ